MSDRRFNDSKKDLVHQILELLGLANIMSGRNNEGGKDLSAQYNTMIQRVDLSLISENELQNILSYLRSNDKGVQQFKRSIEEMRSRDIDLVKEITSDQYADAQEELYELFIALMELQLRIILNQFRKACPEAKEEAGDIKKLIRILTQKVKSVNKFDSINKEQNSIDASKVVFENKSEAARPRLPPRNEQESSQAYINNEINRLRNKDVNEGLTDAEARRLDALEKRRKYLKYKAKYLQLKRNAHLY